MPDLNRGAPKRTGQCRTSTRELWSGLGNAGPQPGSSGADWATPDLTPGPSERSGQRRTSAARRYVRRCVRNMSEKNVRKNVRRYVRRNVRKYVKRFVRSVNRCRFTRLHRYIGCSTRVDWTVMLSTNDDHARASNAHFSASGALSQIRSMR